MSAPRLSRRFGFILVLLAVGATPASQGAPTQHEGPLSLGFFPLTSTVSLFKRFAPLTTYLSTQLDRQVVLETAKDFPTFVKRSRQRRYDILITAPHFAVEAADSGKYQIRATLLKDVQQLVVVHRDSPIEQLSQLAGARIATPPAPALMTMMGKTYLAEAGLTGDKQPVYQAFVSHNAANEAVIAHLADAAIASSNVVGKAVERGAPLRILSRGLQLPNMATLVATDLPPTIADRVAQALIAMRDTAAGSETLKRIGFPGYKAVSAADYEVVRPYAYRGRKPQTSPDQHNAATR